MQNLTKLLNNTAIAPYYFAELGKKLSPKTARVNFQILLNSKAIDEIILKAAQIAYLSELQKEINAYLSKEIFEIKEKMDTEEIPLWMQKEIDKRIKLYEAGKIELINYNDFRKEFLS